MHELKSRIASVSQYPRSATPSSTHIQAKSKRITGAVMAPGLIVEKLDPGNQLFATLGVLPFSERCRAARLPVLTGHCETHPVLSPRSLRLNPIVPGTPAGRSGLDAAGSSSACANPLVIVDEIHIYAVSSFDAP